MKRLRILSIGASLLLVLGWLAPAWAQVPDSLVADGIPTAPESLVSDARRYLEFRAATFHSWHPSRREMLIATRFADVTQLLEVRQPGGARRQLTFLPEPVGGGSYRPKTGEFFVF